MAVLGLVQGRHEIPGVSEYIFPADFFSEPGSMFDFDRIEERVHQVLRSEVEVKLYVTGLTVALTEVIKYCYDFKIALVLYHFDRESGEYVPQYM